MRSGMVGFLGAFSSPAVDLVGQAIAAKTRHWWTFDSTLTDVINFNTLSGSATYTAGHIGQMAVKGSVLQSQPLIVDSSKGITFGGWVYINGTGDENPITTKTSSAAVSTSNQSHYLAVRNSGTQLYLVAYPASGSNLAISSAVGAMAVGGYYFVVGSVSAAGALKLYLNGSPVASGALSGAPKTASYLDIGRGLPVVYNALRNDESFVCQGVLTDAEIEWLYNAGAGRSGAEMLALRPYQEVKTLSLAAWTWFSDPRALIAGDRLVAGGVSNTGVIKVADAPADLSASATEFGFTGTYDADDHDNPAFIRRASDNRLLAFYSRHNDPVMWMRASVNPDDASSWGSAVSLASQVGSGPYSYNNPIQLTSEASSPIYNFFRGGSSPNWTLCMTKSLDDGATWSSAIALLGSGRPYFKIAQNGTDRIDFLVTDGHPAAVATNSVYHFYYQGGAYYDSFGVSIGSPPFSSASLTKVFDGATAAGRAWVWDLKIDGSGNPVAVYSAFPSTTDHRYRYARWTGSVWEDAEICTAGGYLYSGEPYYSGGICIDPEQVTDVYAAREVAGEWGLYKLTTADGGTSWSSSGLVYASEGEKTFRPFIPQSGDHVLFCSGVYNSYTAYLTKMMAVPLAR